MEDEVLRTTQLLDRLGRAIDFPAYLAAHGFKVVPRSSEWGVTMDGTGGVVTLTMDPNKKKWTYAPVASSVNQGLKWTAEGAGSIPARRSWWHSAAIAWANNWRMPRRTW